MGNTNGQAYALMLMTPVVSGQEQALHDYLTGLPTGAGSPLARLTGTHFARWILLHELVYQGPPQEPDSLQSPYLLFTSNFDGKLEPYLRALHQLLRTEADEIWGRCINYPGSADQDAFLGYLMHNQVETSFFFSAYPDATVQAVLGALDLRERLVLAAIATQGAPAAGLRATHQQLLGAPA